MSPSERRHPPSWEHSQNHLSSDVVFGLPTHSRLPLLGHSCARRDCTDSAKIFEGGVGEGLRAYFEAVRTASPKLEYAGSAHDPQAINFAKRSPQ